MAQELPRWSSASAEASRADVGRLSNKRRYGRGRRETFTVKWERLGLGGSMKAAMKAARRAGGEIGGLPLAVFAGLWWWVRRTPVGDEEDAG